MGTVRLTKDLATICMDRLTLSTSAQYGLRDVSNSFFVIFKGAVPIPGLSAFNEGDDRSADALLQWPTFGTGGITTQDNTLSFETSAHDNAMISGEASWFAFYSIANATAVNYNSSSFIYYSVVGTIGLPGSGADLVIGDTNVVAGLPYNVGPFTIKLPQTYTY